MNNNYIVNGVFALMLVSSPLAVAESKYPAADFQPEVVYQDKDYIGEHGGHAADSQYPAADYQPEVLYQNQESIAAASQEVDPRYPAANYQPEVVYQNKDYIGKQKPAPSVSRGSETVQQPAAQPVAAPKKSGSPNMMIALLVLAAAGFFLYKKKGAQAGGSAYARAAYAAPADTSGLTGVARYLKEHKSTGVERYMDKVEQEAAKVTGVDKYVARQAVTEQAEPEAATGVEKYLRSRG